MFRSRLSANACMLAIAMVALAGVSTAFAAEPEPVYELQALPFDAKAAEEVDAPGDIKLVQYQQYAPMPGQYQAPAPAYPSDAYPIYPPTDAGEPWSWQALPEGIMYRSYLAGHREPRFGTAFLYSEDRGWLWDFAVGGRAGLIRYGTTDEFRPTGWQLDVEGAAFPVLDFENNEDLDAVDFRAGVPLTYSNGVFEFKLAYYHVSAHVGDEYLVRNPGFVRDNYVRDAAVLGSRVYLTPDFRIYGEAAYGFNVDGGAEPWELQAGLEYSPAQPTGFRPVPFAAANAHLFEEFDFGGNVNVMAGLQWRSRGTGRLFRIGAQYFNGKSFQYAFFDEYNEFVGAGLWYDF